MAPIEPEGSTAMFRPPIHRGLTKLDRALFKKTVPLAAAKVTDQKDISRTRHALRNDLLKVDRLQSVKQVIDANGQAGKALLLQPQIKPDDAVTWSPTLTQLAKTETIHVIPYDLQLDYSYWDYYEILSSILPEQNLDNIPTGYATVGHVAHLNLRDDHLPHKKIIAEILLDKHPNIRTVINKTDRVGTESAYRTFTYELLAGDPNMNVELSESGCTFRFDYSKVYWNSRLNTEHERLVNEFEPRQAICDVMAGVGPFAVPAGKRGCWVLANDLNPDSLSALQTAIKINKVEKLVQAFNENGHVFIKSATQQLLEHEAEADVTPALPRHLRGKDKTQHQAPVIIKRPRVFAHYVLNLPASAITFLSAFKGLYTDHKGLFSEDAAVRLPLVHVYCFNSEIEQAMVEESICSEISHYLGHKMKPGDQIDEQEATVSILDVRDVAPKKRMFCATFRLPAAVAFGSP